jgi:cation diffusion facilitator CzcD-associated flavoprotein CzcO
MSADHRIAIIGGGFSGLGMAIRLREQGIDDFVVLERGADVGGTWWFNTYPGCQCDIPSHLYSFSFALNPEWSRTYSAQPEIQRYLRGCAERFDILRHIRFETEVTGAAYDEDDAVWRIDTSKGPIAAQILIVAPGGLSAPKLPDIPGLDSFEGTVMHSAQWDGSVEMLGRKVAVIGTGASAIQIVPKIQPDVEKLSVFQRTPPWVVPHRDRKLTRFEHAVYRRLPVVQRAVRAWVYWTRELMVPGLVRDRRFLRIPEFAARKQIEKQVRDPELLDRVTPKYTIGCKRILPSNDWYPAIQRPNTSLVTEGITEVTPRGVVTADGTEHEADTIVCATGFHVTDFPSAEWVRGRDGRRLGEFWNGSPMTFMGSTVPGFPNMFFLTGPNTGLGHNSLVFMIEAQITYVLGALRAMEQSGAAAIEVKQKAYEGWNKALQRRMPQTVWNSGGCKSWYLDRNGMNTTIWPDFTWRFWQKTRQFDTAPYELAPARARDLTAV